MTDHLTPDEIRRASFRVVFRGFDQSEVSARLDELADALAELRAERDRLASRLGELADRDLRSEFETIGREVTEVLEAARQAAETMRERAAADAARWRSEAMVEVETLRKEARADAEALRTDAWTTGTQLLEQVQREVERQRDELERDALAVMGEAEREAHRLTSSARREAEDVLRSAKMEAERLVAQARADHDEIIATAHRQSQAAQERTRALEERRAELMEEIETVRAALSAVESELEERRHGIGLSEPPELPRKMLLLDEEGEEIEGWEEGHTVRVIRPSRPEEETSEPDSGSEAEAPPEEVEVVESVRVVETPAPADTPATEPVEGDAVSEAAEDEPDEEAVEPLAPEPEFVESESESVTGEPAAEPASDDEEVEPATAVHSNGTDDVFDLFRRLRQPGPTEADETTTEGPIAETDAELEPGPASEPESHWPEGVDPFETRDRLLLPITNSTLRAVKRALTETQNEALEQIRISGGDWVPDADALEAAFAEELDSLGDQASQAGVEAAVEMGVTGVATLDPSPPPHEEVGVALAEALAAALHSAGGGSRERQAAASRVFRGWRTDEAERRIRAYALASYHHALRQALENQQRTWQWVPSGRLCPMCRQAADEGGVVPPAHRDCGCTIAPV